MGDPRKTVRCAVYTRKSSEEGLEQSFNSLHAQREACEAYIQSQKHEGWSVIRAQYDDGGFSGGSMERPALKLLLDDIRSGEVDVVVVYKIDRLTRSLFDFAKIVETFDAASVSFVSVTQSFNTTTSMGRLTLNVLLSFAQFEREVTGERIRDKVAASKKKGMWMGGNVPLGYDLKDRMLVVNAAEAQTVVTIFEQYAELGAVRKVKQAIDGIGLRTKFRTSGTDEAARVTGGAPFTTGHLYTILNNPLYIGKVRHKELIHPGEHEAIIAEELWNRVQARLAANSVERAAGSGTKSPSLLTGRIFGVDGNRLTPSHAVKGVKRYRYYVEAAATGVSEPRLRIPAADIERLVTDALRSFLINPQRLLEAFTIDAHSPAEMKRIIERAEHLVADLADEAGGTRAETVRSLVARVYVSLQNVRIEIDRTALAAKLQVDGSTADEHDPLCIEQAITVKRQGREQQLILSSAADRTKPDPTLIKAIVRAHRWFAILQSGQVESIAEIGRMENVPRSWISTQLPLVFLAPDIKQAILDGDQPAAYNLDRLVALAGASLDWSEQRKAFRTT